MKLPAAQDSRVLRFTLFFLCYLAQGLPIGLFGFAVPAWLAAAGADATDIGLFTGAIALPWALKFVNGFIVDRYTYFPMGRRRAWLLGSQAVVIFTLVTLAIINPSTSNIFALAGIVIITSLATNFQDVAIDGLAVDLAPVDEHARINGYMFGAQAIGIASGAGFGGALLARYNLSVALLFVAAIIAIISLFIALTRERSGEKLLPWSNGEPSQEALDRHSGNWRDIFSHLSTTMRKRANALLFASKITAGSVYGAFITIAPIIATNSAKISEAAYSAISGAGALIAGLTGAFAFGWISDRLGHIHAAAMSMGLGAFIFLVMGFADDYRTMIYLIGAFIIIYLCLDTLFKVASSAVAMAQCEVGIEATQFTLFMSGGNIGTVLGAALVGPVGMIGGMPAMITFCIASATLTVFLLLMLGNKRAQT